MAENSFGEIVKRERKRKELSLAKVADAVTNIDNNHKINPSYINRLENGEQSNPSFVIVAMLSTVLNLDMREVFQSFGFEQLIEGYDSEAEFTLEGLIRLHTLKATTGSGNNNETIRRYINNNEKEALIKLLDAVFDYTSDENISPIQKMIRVLEELDSLREIQQKQLNDQETFEFDYMGETFSVELGSLPKGEGFELKELKEDVIEAIEKEIYKFMDYPSGVINMMIGRERWLILKEKYHITLLSKQPGLIKF